jgi:hypothetical protein
LQNAFFAFETCKTRTMPLQKTFLQKRVFCILQNTRNDLQRFRTLCKWSATSCQQQETASSLQKRAQILSVVDCDDDAAVVGGVVIMPRMEIAAPQLSNCMQGIPLGGTTTLLR